MKPYQRISFKDYPQLGCFNTKDLYDHSLKYVNFPNTTIMITDNDKNEIKKLMMHDEYFVLNLLNNKTGIFQKTEIVIDESNKNKNAYTIDDVLKSLPDELKNNKDVMKKAFIFDKKSFKNVSPGLKNNKDFVLDIIDTIPKKQPNNSNIKEINNRYKEIFENIPVDLKNDEDFFDKVFQKKKIYLIYYASDDLKNNKDFVMKVVKNNGLALQYASSILKNDKDFVMKLVENNQKVYNKISEELKNDKDIRAAAGIV